MGPMGPGAVRTGRFRNKNLLHQITLYYWLPKLASPIGPTRFSDLTSSLIWEEWSLTLLCKITIGYEVVHNTAEAICFFDQNFGRKSWKTSQKLKKSDRYFIYSPIRTLVEKIDYCSYSLQYWFEALLLKYDHCFGASRKQKSKKFRSIIKNNPDNLNLFSTYVSGLWLRCYIVFDMP